MKFKSEHYVNYMNVIFKNISQVKFSTVQWFIHRNYSRDFLLAFHLCTLRQHVRPQCQREYIWKTTVARGQDQRISTADFASGQRLNCRYMMPSDPKIHFPIHITTEERAIKTRRRFFECHKYTVIKLRAIKSNKNICKSLMTKLLSKAISEECTTWMDE